MKHRVLAIAGVVALFGLTGCSSTPSALGSLGSPILAPLLSSGYATTSGSHQFFAEESFEKLDLVTLLDPERRRDAQLPNGQIAAPLPSTYENSASSAALPSSAQATELERAFRAFYAYGPRLEDRRSRLQDRIVAASDQRCNTYKNYLRRVETTQSSWLGSLTTVLGGAGAIATHSATVRALSGLAGITSGVSAELRQSYFSSLATQVIVPGIDLARSDIRRDMLSKRTDPLSIYTVEAAVAEAARYHGACSMNVGLERSGKAVTEVSNPGLRMLNTTLGQLNLAQKLARRLNDETVAISDNDLRLADGITLATTTVRSPARQGSFISADMPYLDQFLQGLGDTTSALTQLKSVIDGHVLACNAGAADVQSSAVCKAKTKLTLLAQDTSDPTALPALIKLGMEKVSSDRATELGKHDTKIRQMELLLGLQSQEGEIDARYGLRSVLLNAAEGFEATSKSFDLMAAAIAKARRAVAEGDEATLGTMLKLVKEELDKIT